MSDLIRSESEPTISVSVKQRLVDEPIDCLDIICKAIESHFSDANNLINKALSGMCSSKVLTIERIIGDPSSIEEPNTSSAIYIMGSGVPTDITPANFGMLHLPSDGVYDSKFMILSEMIMVTALAKTSASVSAMSREMFLLLSSIEGYLSGVYNLYGVQAKPSSMSEYMPTKGSHIMSLGVTLDYPFATKYKARESIL